MIPAWCANFVGLPYAPGGRTREGLDCWGLFSLVWTEHFGRPIPDYDGAAWRPGANHHDVARAAESFARRFTLIEAGQEREGDGIMLRVRGVPMHIGMVVAPGFMLHIEQASLSVIEPYRSMMWARRVLSFHRYERDQNG
jgi:cell wall-associated NlpC family hydrolase